MAKRNIDVVILLVVLLALLLLACTDVIPCCSEVRNPDGSIPPGVVCIDTC